jgi:hypothetical protein
MGAWTEIVDFTFTANETSRSFSGLSITEDDFIKIVLTITAGATGGDYNLTANGNDTLTNYHRQYVLAGGTSVSAARNNNAAIAATENGTTSSVIIYLKLSENERLNLFANDTRRNDSSVQTLFQYITSSGATFTSITSLTLTGSTNAIGTGSRIQIYRLDAEKVADITTTANATQVDISSLSIGKDSEYLLVSDFNSGNTNVGLYVNDNTTATNYYTQTIIGDGSSASAVRNNDSFIAFVSNELRALSYVHIKLSEIGAYTAQSYTIRHYGTTSPILQNLFASSTAENITSITKLNVRSVTGSDRILSGTRFILYKLK